MQVNFQTAFYADCFAVATALQYDSSIVTGNRELEEIERLVKID